MLLATHDATPLGIILTLLFPQRGANKVTKFGEIIAANSTVRNRHEPRTGRPLDGQGAVAPGGGFQPVSHEDSDGPLQLCRLPEARVGAAVVTHLADRRP